MMTELIDRVQRLVFVARAHRESGDTPTAVKLFRRGIDTLERGLPKDKGVAEDPVIGVGDVDAREIAVQLVDIYGMLGGILREQGNYRASAAAYDRGFHFEADPRYAMRNTYNALNRLITRILLSPGCLADPDLLRGEPKLEFVDVRHELAELHKLLQGQMAGARAADFWAAGDLSLTCALNGDEQGMTHGLEKFRQLLPPPAAYEAYWCSIKSLAQLDTPRKGLLLKAQTAWSRQ
jgi:hypothetical protein